MQALRTAASLASLPVTASSLVKLRQLRQIVVALKDDAGEDYGGDLHEPWYKYREDPERFFTEALDYFIWSKQREILRALVEYDRVAVTSCHESGKSFCAGGVVGWWIASHPPGDATVVTTAPTFHQVRAVLWREVNRVHIRGNLPGRMNMTEWLLDRELVAFGRKPEDNKPGSFQGIHARHMLGVIDEACGVVAPIVDAIETLVANEGGKILAIGNPDDPNTEFGRMCLPGSGWHVVRISALDTPNFTDEEVPEDLRRRLIHPSWVDRVRRKHGETSPYYISKVLGEFPEVSEDSLISPRLVTDAVNRELEPGLPIEIGADVARFGRNETCIYVRRGSVARLWRVVKSRDTMHVAGLVAQAVVETGATAAKIDDAGLGGGVVDRCDEVKRDRSIQPNPFANCRVIGVNVGRAPIERPEDRAFRPVTARDRSERGKSDPRMRFRNLKAQLCWELRDRFVEGTIDLGDDEDTQAQCSAIRYDLTSQGQISIESKEEVEARLIKIGGATGESGSPDRFDGLVLCFADVEAAPPVRVSKVLLAASRRPGAVQRRAAGRSAGVHV